MKTHDFTTWRVACYKLDMHCIESGGIDGSEAFSGHYRIGHWNGQEGTVADSLDAQGKPITQELLNLDEMPAKPAIEKPEPTRIVLEGGKRLRKTRKPKTMGKEPMPGRDYEYYGDDPQFTRWNRLKDESEEAYKERTKDFK